MIKPTLKSGCLSPAWMKSAAAFTEGRPEVGLIITCPAELVTIGVEARFPIEAPGNTWLLTLPNTHVSLS